MDQPRINISDRVDIMVDLETLSNEMDVTIFQIAAVQFDIHTGDILDTFDLVADIELASNIEANGGTLKWWVTQNTDVLKDLMDRGTLGKKSPEEILRRFHAWLKEKIGYHGKENVFLWGNGIANDNTWLKIAFKKQGLEWPIFFRNDRDVRTVRELHLMRQDFKRDFKGEERTNDRPHDALSDATFQALNIADQVSHLTGMFASVTKETT